MLIFVKLMIIAKLMKKYFILLLVAPLLIISCGGTAEPERHREITPVNPTPTSDPNLEAKQFVKDVMAYYYFWNKEISSKLSTVNMSSYSDVESYFKALLYSGDRWSWMEDGESYTSSETGVINGTWGIGLDQASYANDFRLRISFIYPGSPLAKYGVTRGAVMKAIGGKSLEPFTSEQYAYFLENYYLSPQTFTFGLVDGRDTTFTTTWATSLQTSPVLKTEVFTGEELPNPVGYINYLSFLDNFMTDLANALLDFKSKGVKDLILDLRYNGGGSLNVTDSLLSYIAPPSSANQLYLTLTHNADRREQLDSYYTITPNADNLDLNRIYVIMTDGTASASEVVINSLKPFMGTKIQTVGKQSYGKPNGMYVVLYPNDTQHQAMYSQGNYTLLQYAILPICFYNANKLGEFIPDTGFTPDYDVEDDLYKDFGADEKMIAACLTHIATGNYPPAVKAPAAIFPSGGVKAKLRPEETDEHYGRLVAKPKKILK